MKILECLNDKVVYIYRCVVFWNLMFTRTLQYLYWDYEVKKHFMIKSTKWIDLWHFVDKSNFSPFENLFCWSRRLFIGDLSILVVCLVFAYCSIRFTVKMPELDPAHATVIASLKTYYALSRNASTAQKQIIAQVWLFFNFNMEICLFLMISLIAKHTLF